MKCPNCGYTDEAPAITSATDAPLMPDAMLFGSTGKSVQAIATKFDSWLSRRPDLCSLIQNECAEHDINEIYALALMQKEQSAFFPKTPPKPHALDWIYGYGCPESGGRQSRFQGVENQIRCALAQLRNYTVSKNFPQVKNWRTAGLVKLYDSAATLKKLGFDALFHPRSMAEAASMLYNPRAEGLVNQVEFCKKILKGA